MRWYWSVLLASMAITPGTGLAQAVSILPVGHIARVEDRSPTTWAMSGMDMIHLTRSEGTWTPIMRSLRMDARTVEILSRTQTPPLRSRDVRTIQQNGHQYVMVRRYMLAEVFSQDARAEGTTVRLLAERWTRAVRAVLPLVAPLPNRFGI